MFRAILFLNAILLWSRIPVSAEPIRMGVTVPLTGDFASYGQLIREGVELARKDLGDAGIAINVLYEDACLPADAVTSIKKLVSSDHIQALAANFCVIAMPPMSETLERNHVIAFHTASASDSILNAGDYIFTTNIKVQSEARKVAEYAAQVLGAKTASVLYITTDFGQDYAQHFSKRFAELGGRVVTTDTNPPGANDFRSELTKVKAKSPDVLFAVHLGPSLGFLLKQARALGISAPVLGVYEAEDSSVLQTAGDAAEGLRFFVPEPLSDTPAVLEFRKKFETTYKHPPRILASNAYDATVIAANALTKCSLDAVCAKNQIYSIRDYPGVSGTFSLEPDGGTTKEFVLKMVHHGAFERPSEDAFTNRASASPATRLPSGVQ